MELDCGLAEAYIAARAVGSLAPDCERNLRDHLETCVACSRVAVELHPSTVAATLANEDSNRIEIDLPELTVIESETYIRGQEIGRGGMGHILRARDRRLGRTVAIKELIDQRLRARFEREARLTARLQHPAIVSVYEAGQWPTGEPFYAMKYVAGRPLAEVVAGLPLLVDRVRLLPNLTTVADAIAYAHSEGVLHRDLKPHNILIGPFGETVVIDWGLAKELGSASDAATPYRDGDDGPLTQGGAGTPAYMPPEQARGETPDERVDVFALGATLYHVLAGDAPGGKPLPDDTPRELAAIVAKATAPRREDRYATAGELAEELRRFQAGKLVAAHRYTVGERLRRFVRRHRALVSLSAVFVAVLAATAFVSVRRIIAERDQARAAQAEAVTQRRGAERLLDYMLYTLRPRLDKIGKVNILAGVGKEVADYFESVPPAGEYEATFLLRRAAAFEVLALADFGMAHVDDVLREGAARAGLCERAYALAPTAEAARCMANVRIRMAMTRLMRGEHGLALDELAAARLQLDRAFVFYPRDVGLRHEELGLARYRARAYLALNDFARAREAATEGVAVAERLLEDNPRSPEFLREAAVSLYDLGRIEKGDGHPERALAPYARSVKLSAEDRALEPEDARAATSWAINTGVVAEAEIESGDPRAAHVRLVPAIALLRAHLADDRDNVEARNRLAYAVSVDCKAELAAGHSRASCLEARGLWSQILEKEPDHAAAAQSTVLRELDIATAALADKDLSGAHDAIERATAVTEPWIRKTTGQTDWHLYRIQLNCLRARLAGAERKPAEARTYARTALFLAGASLPTTGPIMSERLWAEVMIEVANADAENGDDGAAETGLRQLAARLERATERWPGFADMRQSLAAAYVQLAEVRRRHAGDAEAATLRARALAIIEPLENKGAVNADLADVAARARRLPRAKP